jgi:hypothetical protein
VTHPLFQFCDVATFSIIHKWEFAKFSYKVREKKPFWFKSKNPAIFLAPASTYCLNMVISEISSLRMEFFWVVKWPNLATKQILC